MPQSVLKLSPLETVYGRPSQVSVSGIPALDLEHESKIKQYVQHLGQTLTALHKFDHCRSIYPSDESLLRSSQETSLTKDLEDSRS